MTVLGKFYVEDGHLDTAEGFKIDESANNKLIYEVIRIVDEVPLFLEGHMERFENSFKIEEIGFPYKFDKLKEYINSLVKANNIAEGNIKIIFESANDTLKLFFIKHSYPTKEMYKDGVNTILYTGERKNPNAKVVDNNFREKVTKEIEEKEAFEAILLNFNGKVSEGSKSNIFFIKNNELFTSQVKDVLPGITRKEIIELAQENEIKVNEVEIDKEEISGFESAFICGTSPKILPIKLIDHIKMSVKNELLLELMGKFDDKIKEYILENRSKV